MYISNEANLVLLLIHQIFATLTHIVMKPTLVHQLNNFDGGFLVTMVYLMREENVDVYSLVG